MTTVGQSEHTLDPQAQALLDAAKASGLPPVYQLPVAEARERMRAAFISPDEPIGVHAVEDLVVPGPAGGIPIRIYHPYPPTYAVYPPSPDLTPGVLFLHGGGWVVNDIDTHDHLCRRLALESRAVFVSAEYRRSPEHRYPAALEDAYVVWRWMNDRFNQVGLDAKRLAVAGDSSGGTLATALCLLCRDRGAPVPAAQVLGYVVTRMYDETASYDELATGYSLNRDFMHWFLDHYIDARTDRDDPYLFPSRAADLGSLPPALVLTAEFDPLRDEGAEYAEKLRSAGVAAEHWHLENQMHGFLMQDRAIARASETIDNVGRWLADTLG